MTANLKLYDLQETMKVEKGVERKHAAMKRALSLMQFLVDNGMIRFDPFYSNGELKRDLVVWASDVSEEGRLFMLEEWPDWKDWVDQGGDPSNRSVLERRLLSLRERHKSA